MVVLYTLTCAKDGVSKRLMKEVFLTAYRSKLFQITNLLELYVLNQPGVDLIIISNFEDLHLVKRFVFNSGCDCLHQIEECLLLQGIGRL